MTATQLVYAYAVALHADGLDHVAAALAGVDSSPVHLVLPSHGRDPVVAVSPVPAADFDETALRRHLEELPWLEEIARAHHQVIEELAAHTTVLPLRLATVYLDDDRVRAVLDSQGEVFLDRLAQLSGRVEWGAKLYVDADAARPAPAPSDLGPGRAYLHHRQAEQSLRQDSYRAAQQAAERIDAAARAHAVGRVRHRVQQGTLASGPGVNVTNDAYLVPAEHSEAFRTEVTRSTDGLPGVRVEVTGPWAPYSFATAPPEEEADP